MESNLTIYVKTGNVEITNQKPNTLQLNSDPAQFVKGFISEHNTSESAHTYIQGRITLNSEIISAHMADSNNPHVVTQAQVGLGNVDNTSDLDKPISTATQTALNGKQDTISDLSTIRSGAELGATAVQPVDLATVATSGSYNDLLDQPTIPTVNDATLTIQKNGTNVATFTANNSSNATANITVPTQASDIGAQETLVSGTNIKTINNNSLLGSGNIDTLPSQTGQSGKFLTTDGTDASWTDVDALPSQAGQNGKFLTTNGSAASWADVDALPSQTGQQGKYLTTDGTTASWDIPMAAMPLFYHTFQDHVLNNASWLRADTFSWQSGDVYVSAYQHLVDDIDGITSETETISGTTITFYRATDGHKIVLADQETNVSTIYTATGVAWYYILDTDNTRFKLPRSKWSFVGFRDNVGNYVAESLPNINGKFYSPQIYGSAGSFYGAGTGTTWAVSGSTANNSAVLDASRSSSTYQNDAPVQQRATQMYLYFYVGNTVQDQTTIDVGEITEDLNGKADIDLDNLSNAGKIVGSGLGMPSNSYDDLTLGVDGTNYTAPADGYFFLHKSSGTASSAYLVGINNNASGFYDIVWGPNFAADDLSLIIPAKSGDSVTIGYSANGTTKKFRFIYAEGSKSLA